MMSREQIAKVMTSTEFTEAEKFICHAEYAHASLSGFGLALWNLLCVADSGNLAKLALGWPDHVSALNEWRYGALMQRFEKAIDTLDEIERRIKNCEKR